MFKIFFFFIIIILHRAWHLVLETRSICRRRNKSRTTLNKKKSFEL